MYRKMSEKHYLYFFKAVSSIIISVGKSEEKYLEVIHICRYPEQRVCIYIFKLRKKSPFTQTILKRSLLKLVTFENTQLP